MHDTLKLEKSADAKSKYLIQKCILKKLVWEIIRILLQKECVRLGNVCMFFALVAMDAIRSDGHTSLILSCHALMSISHNVSIDSLLRSSLSLVSVWRIKDGEIGEKGTLLACSLLLSWWNANSDNIKLLSLKGAVPRGFWYFWSILC